MSAQDVGVGADAGADAGAKHLSVPRSDIAGAKGSREGAKRARKKTSKAPAAPKSSGKGRRPRAPKPDAWPSTRTLGPALARDGAELRVELRVVDAQAPVSDPGDDLEAAWLLLGVDLERRVTVVVPVGRPRVLLELRPDYWRPSSFSPPKRTRHAGYCEQVLPRGQRGRGLVRENGEPRHQCGRPVPYAAGFYLSSRPKGRRIACMACAERQFPGVIAADARRDARHDRYVALQNARDLGTGTPRPDRSARGVEAESVECRCERFLHTGTCKHSEGVKIKTDTDDDGLLSLATLRRRIFGMDPATWRPGGKKERALRDLVARQRQTVRQLRRASKLVDEAAERKRLEKLVRDIDQCGTQRKTLSCSACGVRIVGPPVFVCGKRLCGLCGRARSARMVKRLRAVIAETNASVEHLSMWTLTVKNVEALSPKVWRRLHAMFLRLLALLDWRMPGVVRGGLRCLETTWSTWTADGRADGSWHIHIHAIMWHEVPVPQSLLSDLWWAASNWTGYHAHVVRIYDGIERAGAEAAKGQPADTDGLGFLERVVAEIGDYVTKQTQVEDPLAIVELEKSMTRVHMADFVGEWRDADRSIRKRESLGAIDDPTPQPGDDPNVYDAVMRHLDDPGDAAPTDCACPECGTQGELFRDMDEFVGPLLLKQILGREPGELLKVERLTKSIARSRFLHDRLRTREPQDPVDGHTDAQQAVEETSPVVERPTQLELFGTGRPPESDRLHEGSTNGAPDEERDRGP